MDMHAASMANRLLNNPPWAPVIEMLLQGAKLEVLAPVWIALTGADMWSNHPMWRAVELSDGDEIILPHNRAGVWGYLAIDGGFCAEQWLDSASTLASAGLGRPLEQDDLLFRKPTEPPLALPRGVGGRFAAPSECRRYHDSPTLRVWPGPQWDWFSDAARHAFFDQRWTVATQSNRVGYRLTGRALEVPDRSLVSEPILVGTVQVPPDGQPLVILRDGPTVGGYPKLALIDPACVDRLVQCRPGQDVTFSLVHD
jgi:antagonist of KipI